MLGDAAFDFRRDLVADADIGEGAAHHDFVIAAAGAVAVEFRHRHATVDQVFTGGRSGLERTGGRDVIGGDRVAEDAEHAGFDDVGDAIRRHGHALEIGRVGDVGRA